MNAAGLGHQTSVTSLWLDTFQTPSSDPLPEGPVDEIVVGAGITGLTTALLLARAGRRVAVVEARHVGAVTTGNTTAKVSMLQGTKYTGLLRYQAKHVAEAYVEANREGQQWLLRFCEDHGVPVQQRAAYTYAAKESEVSTVRKEHDAAASLGLAVRWQDTLDTPFPSFGATVLEEQLQFDPMDFLGALVGQLRGHGGTLHQGHRVTGASISGPPEVTLDDGTTLRAENVVLATGMPILDRGLYFAKEEPERSYALAFDWPTPPEGMYLSAGSDSRSIRDAPGHGGTKLLIGGSGHTVGRTSSEQKHVDRLREWTAKYFPGAIETHQWSAQDYSPVDGMPFVGHLPRSGGHIYVATGFDKWGMTNGVAAARALSGRILGSEPSWAKPFDRRNPRLSGLAHLGTINAKVGAAQVASALGLLRGGRSCEVVGICTHLGGVLKWNDAEDTWDCPLHGSRFAPDGQVLEGPATKPLKRRTPKS
jgi:glycine/D-amino acid oxidase-like deaminating enzyme/nitrite reductase/ring-hydroxylating ferredoxin subunit